MRYAIPLLLLAVAAAPLAAQRGPRFERPSVIRASGEGVVRIAPNQATITIGVVTQAKTAEEASGANARQVEAALEKLKLQLGDDARYETSGYSIRPDRRDPRSGSGPEIVSFTASNSIQVTIDDVEQVGAALDSAAAAGANQIHGIEFGLKDDTAARRQAMTLAAREARANIDTLAEALGVQVSRIASIEEGESSRNRPMMFAAAMERAGGTPVEAGEVEVRATVTVTAEFTQ